MKNSDRIFRTLGAMVVLATLVPLGAPGVKSQPMTKDEVAKKLVGAWRYVGTTIDGVNKPRGNNPTGMIYYGPHGEMAVQIAPDIERKRAGAEMTPDEAKAALTDYIAYFGTYTIDEKAGTVTHHRQSSVQPGDRGDFVRQYQFVDDRLILRPPNSKQEITWERIK
jgi:hypothetical protein